MADHQAGRLMVGLDLNDTTRCPLAAACERCGSTTDLAVGVAETSLGVHCMTLCGACADTAELPRLTPVAAVTRAAEHCGHLGVDLDQMAAALAAERAADRDGAGDGQ